MDGKIYRTAIRLIRTFIIAAYPVWVSTNYSYTKGAIVSAIIAGILAL